MNRAIRGLSEFHSGGLREILGEDLTLTNGVLLNEITGFGVWDWSSLCSAELCLIVFMLWTASIEDTVENIWLWSRSRSFWVPAFNWSFVLGGYTLSLSSYQNHIQSRDAVVHGILLNHSIRPLRSNTHMWTGIMVRLSISYNFQNVPTALLTTRKLYIQSHKTSLEPVKISLGPISALYANRSWRREEKLKTKWSQL